MTPSAPDAKNGGLCSIILDILGLLLLVPVIAIVLTIAHGVFS